MTQPTSQLTGLLNFANRKQAEEKEKQEAFRTALELLNRFVATEEIKIQEGRIESEAQEEDYKEAGAFLNKYYNKKYDV